MVTRPSRRRAQGATPAAGAADFYEEKFSQPAYLIRRAHQISVAMFEEEFRGLDLTPIQFSILLILRIHPGSDQTRIAGLAAIDKTSCFRGVDNLVRRKLVGVAIAGDDRRKRELVLTAAGEALHDQALARSQSLQTRLLEKLSQKQQHDFVEALRIFVETYNEFSRAPQLASRTGKPRIQARS